MRRGHTYGMLPHHLFIDADGEMAAGDNGDFWGEAGYFETLMVIAGQRVDVARKMADTLTLGKV